jgi:hypothetical protein
LSITYVTMLLAKLAQPHVKVLIDDTKFRDDAPVALRRVRMVDNVVSRSR